MKFRIRRLLPKMVPKLVIDQKMESIKETSRKASLSPFEDFETASKYKKSFDFGRNS